MAKTIVIPPTPKRYFKGTPEEYAALNKAISDRFNYPDHGTNIYYAQEPAIDVDGDCIMEIDGFIQDMMPEVFESIVLHDSVVWVIEETPENETEL